jgi:hypothetical protein
VGVSISETEGVWETADRERLSDGRLSDGVIECVMRGDLVSRRDSVLVFVGVNVSVCSKDGVADEVGTVAVTEASSVSVRVRVWPRDPREALSLALRSTEGVNDSLSVRLFQTDGGRSFRARLMLPRTRSLGVFATHEIELNPRL